MKLRALDPLLHPQYEDMLHKESSFVEHFYQLITQSIEPPFAISIDGLWGTGKTTVMQMLQSKLRERDGGYPVFWFNPWEYQEAESVVLAFLQRFSDETSGLIDKTVRESLKLLGTVGLLSLDVALSALPAKILSFSLEKIKNLKKIKETGEMFEEQYLKEYEKYKDIIKVIQEDFRKLINNLSEKHDGKPVIIFFDDLDRCLPDKTIQLLEAVKNLFVVRDTNVIFICGIDTHIAKQFIKSHYKDIKETFAINYFRKIFNLTISMPHSSDIRKLLIDYIEDLYGREEKQTLEMLASKIYNAGIQAEMESIRKYLNVINNFYTFQQFNPACRADEEKDFVLHLLIVKEAWQPLYERIIKKALRERTKTMGDLIRDVLHNREVEGYSLTGQQASFLSYYFTREASPFQKLQLANEFLYKYPTLT